VGVADCVAVGVCVAVARVALAVPVAVDLVVAVLVDVRVAVTAAGGRVIVAVAVADDVRVAVGGGGGGAHFVSEASSTKIKNCRKVIRPARRSAKAAFHTQRRCCSWGAGHGQSWSMLHPLLLTTMCGGVPGQRSPPSLTPSASASCTEAAAILPSRSGMATRRIAAVEIRIILLDTNVPPGP